MSDNRAKLIVGSMAGFVIVGALASYAWSSIQADLAKVPTHELSIALIEAKDIEQDKTDARVESRLDRIERKIDLLVRDRGIKVEDR